MAEEKHSSITLKVSEAGPRDVGRGIARIDPKVMEKLGIADPGEVISIKGKRETVAKVMPTFPEFRGKGLVQIDGIIRENAQAGVDEKVKLNKVEAEEARKVTLSPLTLIAGTLTDSAYLSRQLSAIPVVAGDRVQATFLGTRKQDFKVLDTVPTGAVLLTPETTISITGEGKAVEAKLTYEDIGGLGEQIKRIREMIELPLRFPQVFARLGVEPPKGVLLHGPPGCIVGDSLIALENGILIRIEELAQNLFPGIYVADLPIYPPASAKAIHVYDVPETIEIKTETGKRLRMTLNHPLMTDEGWKEAEKLEIGDRIQVFRWLPSPSQYVSVDFQVDNRRLHKKIDLPKFWDENLGEIFGIFLAEGSVGERRVFFTIGGDEEELANVLKEKMKSLFDIDCHILPKKGKNCKVLRFENRGLRDFFSQYWSKEEKRIPSSILMSPNSVAASFLRGLFEGDAYVRPREETFKKAYLKKSYAGIFLKNKSRRLLEETQTLLLRFGIISRISKAEEYKTKKGTISKTFLLSIRSKENVVKFKDNIGLISRRKRHQLLTTIKRYKRNLRYLYHKGDFERITSVKKLYGWQRVYDFEVPSSHSFFSNGVLSHNTGKTLIARVIANETDAYFLQLSGPQIMHKFYGESLPGDESVLVLNDKHLKRRPIGKIVAEGNTSLQVPCFGPDGKIQFGKVIGFHKHPFNGRLLRVRTASGRSIRVTDAHSLFTLDADGIKSTKTSELVIGQSFVAVPKCLPFVAEPLGEINLLSLLKNDNNITARGPYVEQLLRQAVGVLGRKRCAALLEVRVKYTYDLLDKHVGIRLPRFLRLVEAANLTVDPSRVTLSTIKRRKGIPAIMKLSEDLCTFFGLWLAEGSYSHGNMVRLSVNGEEAQQVISLCRRLFSKVTVYRPEGVNSVDVIVCSTPLVRAMQALGFVSGARRKRVPAFVYNLSRSNLAALLRGYISGDGSVNRTTPAPQVEIGTASLALADGICHLLLFFGIVAKIYDRVSESSKRICFADAENLERFLEIGFSDPAKNSVIKEYLDKAPASRRDRMPLATVQDQLGWKVNAWEGLAGIGVKAAKRRFKSLPTQLKPALEGDLFWDKVVVVEELSEHPEFVYDIAVKPGENFIAGFGGIFAHNSEAHLRSVFEEAKKNAPAILFLDELDAIAPKREELGGEKQVERRVVATLLAEMDGLESRGELVVIGASVTGDTPILVKNEGLIKIAELIDPFYKTNEEGRKPVNGLEVLGYEPQGNDPRYEARRFTSAKFQPVQAVFRHKVDEIYEIEFTGKHSIRVTGDHSLFVRDHGGVKSVRASDLRGGDMLVGLPYSSYMFGRFTRPVIFDSVVPNIPFSSPLEKETAYLFGLWLAEGCVAANKRIDFCLSIKERDLIDRVKAWAKRLGRKPYNHPTHLGGAVNTGFTYADLARFITKNFGRGAKNKYLPSWVFTLPDELFLSLLSGWAAGDGWNGKDGRVEITTISHKLAIDMLWACRMHNIWATMQSFHYTGFGEGTAYRFKISMANNPWNNSQSKRWPKRVQPRVKSIRRLLFDGYVYDLCGCAGEAFYGGEIPILLHNTNLPNILDPALRRPGRFDREIVIPIPDKNGRREILAIHTRGMPLSDDVDLEKLAFLTHGFVGADLAALCREAAMYALRRLMPKIDFEQEVIPQEALLSLEVTTDDFLNALREIEPSAIREVFTEIPEVKLEDIGGLEDIKRILTETICEPLYHPKVYAKAKTKPAKGILLTGEPGTGKTLLVKAIAKEAEVNFIAVKGPELLSKYVGESEKGVREVFKKAKQAAPSILFFDEIEALVPKRGKLMGEQVTERVVSQFLTEMDGIEELKGVVILASTNRPDLLDPALLRPGRFDFVLELPKPDQAAREEIFKIHTKGKPLAKDVGLSQLARETSGMVGAEIASICQKASLLAIREFLASKEKDLEKLKIKKKHFIEAMGKNQKLKIKNEKHKVT